MKTNEEIAALAFARREEHIQRSKTRSKVVMITLISLIAALNVFTIVEVHKTIELEKRVDELKAQASDREQEIRRLENSLTTISSEVLGRVAETSVNGSKFISLFEDDIIVNEIEDYSVLSDFAGEATTREAIEAQFDIKVIPDAPEGFDTAYYAECFGGDETPLYWYHSIFTSDVRNGWLQTMVTNRDPQLSEATALPDTGADSVSCINGVEIKIFHCTHLHGDENGIKSTVDEYVCSFEYGGKYFWMLSDDLDENEFIEAIRSIVEQ